MYWALAVAVLLIFPFMFNITVYFNERVKKVILIIDLFGFINILSGYFTYKNNIIYLHISKKRAIAMKILPTTTMIRGNSQFYKSIEIFSLNEFLSLPLKANCVFFANALNVANSILLPLYKNQKPFMDIDADILLGKINYTVFYVQTKIILNLVVLITIIVRKIISGVINEQSKQN